MRPPRPVRATACLLVLVLLADHGLGLPFPAERASWPDVWGLLRGIRDTTAVPAAVPKTQSAAVGNKTQTSASTPRPPPRASPLEQVTMQVTKQVTKQVSDRMANMFHSVRSSLWQLTGTTTSSTETPTKTPRTAASTKEADLETGASSDVLGKEAADRREPEDAAEVAAAAPTALRQQQPQQQQPAEPQGFVSSAIERVRGASRTFSEMGRAVGRWGKAMADSVVGSTVNSAVGTVLQVMKGGKQDDDADHVCFPDLGCFGLLEPWASSKRPLPRMNAPEDIQTRFLLYTRNTSWAAEPVVLRATSNDTVANATALLAGVPTVFVVHGFNDKAAAAWVQDMKDALLERLDSNVILVDWAPGALASRNYLQAASNTRVVGAELARMVELLAGEAAAPVPMDSVHVIGHSLGAHAAGYAGKQLNGKLGRITALDAAQPAFEDQVAEVRVAAGDARFVDVVHTNGVPFIPTLGLGVMQPIGDVDFFLNGGTVQPGCFVPKLPAVQSLMDLAALPVSVLGDLLSCSHRRAIEYFTEAVRGECRMWGRRRAAEGHEADREGGDKDAAAAESSSPGSRTRQASWWPVGGLSGLFAGVFSSGDKPSPAKVPAGTKASPTTEAPATTGPGRPAGGLSFPLPGFLASVFSSGVPTANKSTLIVKDKAADVRPVESNGLGDKGADYPSAPGDALAADSRHVSTSSKRSPSTLPPAPSWCGVNDCLPLGLEAVRYNQKGVFDVQTADHAPYCISRK